MMKPFLCISNRHVPDAGTPPDLTRLIEAGTHYIGYFQNEYGEQSVYLYSYENKTAVVYLGDAGWEVAHQVIDGIPEDLVMNEPEWLWLMSCWLATAGRELNLTQKDVVMYYLKRNAAFMTGLRPAKKAKTKDG